MKLQLRLSCVDRRRRLPLWACLFLLLGLSPLATAAAQDAEPRFVTNGVKMKLRRIPAGVFWLGSPPEEPQRREHELRRRVKIAKPFFLGITEVTQKQWLDVMGSKPWARQPYVREHQQAAASYVTWHGAVEFCRRLSRREKRVYRLPTEAEWEFACRARTTTAFSFGADEARMGEFGWFGGNAFDVGERYAHPVAQKKPNPWGLFDMHGNNWEWCSDAFAAAASETRQRSSHALRRRVIRGGSWHGSAGLCRSASRFSRAPTARLNDLGFRVVLEVQP